MELRHFTNFTAQRSGELSSIMFSSGLYYCDGRPEDQISYVSVSATEAHRQLAFLIKFF
jgi:hypothetical protein